MKKTSKILAIMTIIIFVLSLVLPIKVNAANGTLSVDLSREGNTINITATDTQYNIVDLKYVHKDIDKDNISYFEENNNDVYTFLITPSQNISETFELDEYGTYTVYAKNSRGDRYLSRITVYDPGQIPDLTLIQDESNPLSLTIQVTSQSSIISTLKIAKINDINEVVDFDKEGTNIDFIQSNNVNLVYEVSEEGLYEIYAKDENGANITRQIYLSQSKTPIDIEITDLENREVNLKVTDKICDITTIKVAKASEISDFDDFETKGNNIDFSKGKEVNVNYTLTEDGTYTFFVEDEAGYRRMINKRVVSSEEKPLKVDISQDENNPGNLTITGTSTLSNIVKMKVAIGENINVDYFKDGGESLAITPGKEVTANYTVNENCVLNVYLEDEDGYRYMLSAHIIGIDEPQPNEPPQITKLSQNQTNLRQIDVVVSDIDSYIDTVKWAKGSHDINYFKSNGTTIGGENLGRIVETQFMIDSIGTYTVFAEDEEGTSTVKEINILSIDEVEKPDTTLPVINGVMDNGIYKNPVTPNATDENLSSVTLTRNGTVVNNYQNGDTISEEGSYVLTAKDKLENETEVRFTIDFTAPEVKITKENTDSKNVAVTIDLTDNLSGVDILKVANGNQNESYFENGGQQIDIIKKGISATGKINVTKNGIYTTYVKDLAGNSRVQTFEVTTIEDEEEPEPKPDTTAPTINLEKKVLQDNKSVNLTINVVDTESQIKIVKMANGDRDVSYFKNDGTELNMEKGNKTATSVANITENGTYTIYSEDEAGNKTVKTVTITEIEENEPEPEPGDTTPPTISGVENGRTYKNYVTPQVTDENLAEVTLTRNGNVVENYTNGTQIRENGNYVLTAVDEAGNRTQVSFTIDIEEPEDNTTNNTNTNTNTENDTNTNTNTGTNTNTDNENNTNTNVNTNTNTNNSVNNNQNNVNIPSGNVDNNSNNNNSGSISTNNYNSSNSNMASTKLPYAGIGNAIIIAIIALGIIAIFTYIKYRKYRKL